MLYSNLQLNHTFLIDNTALEVNHGITLINSKMVGNNITVNYTKNSFLNQNSFNVDTGFFNLNFQSTLICKFFIIHLT